MIVRVRPTDDFDAVSELDRACFGPQELLTEDAFDRCEWWLAETDAGEPVGFAGARVCATNASLVYLAKSGVAPAARGHRLQRRLIHVRLAWARRQPGRTHAITYTLASNPASSNNLIACGFKTYHDAWTGEPSAVYWIRGLHAAGKVAA